MQVVPNRAGYLTKIDLNGLNEKRQTNALTRNQEL